MTKRRLSENMLWICVNQCEEHRIQGVLSSIMKEQVMVFHDFDQLVLKADALFDEIEYPQSFQEKRSFKEPQTKVEFTKARREPLLEDEAVKKQHGTCFTGIIMVETRQFTNWQGCVMNEEFEVLFQFRDVIELMRELMKLCN